MDREKVIKAIETHLSTDISVGCDDCTYENDGWCTTRLLADILAVLKEQEPIEAKIMGESKSHGSWWFACGACGHAIDIEDNYCRECGRPVKWVE